jgi:nucleoside-diphosphate-sugar epimerase
MKALVTGGGGFLGRYIVEQLLARGDDVAILSRGHYPDLATQGVTVIQGDITNAATVIQACMGMETVFHVAARPGVWGTWNSFYQPNVLGTQNIVAACQEEGVTKLVYTSSPSVIFDNQAHEGADESLPYPLEFENMYSHTKALAEQVVIKANGKQGLATVSLRPHLIWGPRDTQLLPRLLARAQAGRLIQVGDGTNKVDLTYVEDAARAHLLAADALGPDSPVAGSVYFISQDEPVLLWPWTSELLQQLKLPPIKRRVSKVVARAVGGVLEACYYILRLPGEPPMTRFLGSVLAMSHYYDISKAKQDFGYKPQYSMAAALAKTLAEMKKERGRKGENNG